MISAALRLHSSVTQTCVNSDLKQELKDIKAELEKLQAEVDRSKRRVCLGQVASIVDDAAAEFVYGEDFFGHTSLRDLRNDLQEITAEQQERYQHLSTFL